jgi:hypothetical protein
MNDAREVKRQRELSACCADVEVQWVRLCPPFRCPIPSCQRSLMNTVCAPHPPMIPLCAEICLLSCGLRFFFLILEKLVKQTNKKLWLRSFPNKLSNFQHLSDRNAVVYRFLFPLGSIPLSQWSVGVFPFQHCIQVTDKNDRLFSLLLANFKTKKPCVLSFFPFSLLVYW